MYKQASYTKYQKKVIKFLSDTLGVDTPFSYEKAQNNHLKVLIDGVSCPLFTGSTPSDSKAINNFKAEVKRKVAQSKEVEKDEKDQTTEAVATVSASIQQSLDKIIQTCLKSLRPRIDMMKAKEEELALSADSLDEIREYRLTEIKNAITLAMRAQKATIYFKAKEMKELELKILEHVDFWLPTLAYYADLIGSKETAFVGDNVVVLEDVSKSEPKKETVTVKNKPEIKANIGIKKGQIKSNLTTDLMHMSANKRIQLLRTLSRADALQLVNEINQALLMNKERDILEVVSMIRERDLKIDEIVARLDMDNISNS